MMHVLASSVARGAERLVIGGLNLRLCNLSAISTPFHQAGNVYMLAYAFVIVRS